MRGGSPAAGTDHAWAAAAHISPLCKVAGPPMINSTGEQNGGSGRGYLAVGGASQQSRYGLSDGRLFCIFIHRHPWGECPHLPLSGWLRFPVEGSASGVRARP